MPLMNRLLGALRGAANPGHTGRGPRPAPGGAPGARPTGGGLAGVVGSLLGGRRRRPRL